MIKTRVIQMRNIEKEYPRLLIPEICLYCKKKNTI